MAVEDLAMGSAGVLDAAIGMVDEGGARCWIAIISAFSYNELLRWSAMLQPTISRVAMSLTAARYRRDGRRNRLKGGRGTLEKEKPPIFGMIERGGQVVIRMLANVQQATIHPTIEKPKARTSILTSIASTPGFLVSATVTRQSAIVEANTPGTRTAMASARSTSTPWRGHRRICSESYAKDRRAQTSVYANVP